MISPGDFLTNLAAALAYDLLRAGAARLQRMAFGSPEQQALRRCYEAAFVAMLKQVAAGLDDDHQKLVGDILREFVATPAVTDTLLDLALAGAETPDLPALRRAFDALNFDRATLSVDFDAALTAFQGGLATALVDEAGQAGSPLFNRVNLGRALAMQALLQAQRHTLDEIVRRLAQLETAPTVVYNIIISHATGVAIGDMARVEQAVPADVAAILDEVLAILRERRGASEESQQQRDRSEVAGKLGNQPEPAGSKDIKDELDRLRRIRSSAAKSATKDSEIQQLLERIKEEQGNNWSGLDLSHLRVKGQDFRETLLQDVYAWDTTFEACKFRHAFGSVSALAVSPDGKLLAMGDNSGRIFVWEAPDLARLAFDLTGNGRSSTVRSLKFALLDSSHKWSLLSAGDDGRVLRWSLSGRQIPAPTPTPIKLKEIQGRALCVSASPDGRWIFFGDEHGTLHYVRSDAKKGGELSKLHKDWVVAAEFLGGGGPPWLLVTGGQEGSLTILNIEREQGKDDKLIIGQVWQHSLTNRLRTIIADPRGAFFITGDEGSTITLFAVKRSVASNQVSKIQITTQCRLQPPSGRRTWGRVWSLALSPCGRSLAAGADDGILRIWSVQSLMQGNPATPQPIATSEDLTDEGHTDRIWSVAFLDDNQIVTGGDDQMLVRWMLRVNDKQGQLPLYPAKSVQGYSNRIWTIAAYIGNNDENNENLKNLLAYAGDFVDLRGDAKTTNCHRFGIFDRRYGDVTPDLPFDELQAPWGEDRPRGRIEVVAWHPSQKTLALAGHRREIILVAPEEQGKSFQRVNAIGLEPDDGWVYTAAWHPEQKWLAYGTQAGGVWLWNRLEDKTKEQLASLSKPVRAIAFSAGGNILAAAAEDGQIRCWRKTENGYEQFLFTDISNGKQSQPVRALAFHPKVKGILVSGDDSKAIRLWQVDIEAKSLTQIAEYRAVEQEGATGKDQDPLYHTDRIRALAFHLKGHLLASGDDDGNVIIWRYAEQDGKPALTSLGVLRHRNQEMQARNQDQASGKLLPTHQSRVRSLSFFADGDLATCCEAETDSVIIWRYRYKDYKDGTPPDTITRASVLFDRSRVFYARRPYERFDFTHANFLHTGEAGERHHIKTRLEQLGGVEAVTQHKRVKQIRKQIQKAVQSLYGANPPSKNASTIRKAMNDYLSEAQEPQEVKQGTLDTQAQESPQQKRRIGPPDALADWWNRLDDYENRLRILLDEGRETFYLVRGEWEEEEVARFLVRLCFILRRRAEGAGLALQEDLEEILLGGNDGFWSSPHYYSWPFVWASVSPGKLEDLPKTWEKEKFGKYVSLGFLAENLRLEMPSRAPNYREFFDGEEITFLANPNQPSEKLPIACTILDAHVRSDLNTLVWDYRSEEFEFSDEKLKELQKTFQQILTKILAQRERVFEDNEMARLFAVDRNTWCFQPVRYSCYCVTNLPISFGMTAVEKQKSMLDWLCPLDEQTGRRKLPELSNCQLGNHLGVDCIVITRDGYLLMYRRLPDELTDPNMVGFVPSMAMRYYVQQKELSLPRVREFCATITHDGQERQVHTPISAIIVRLCEELRVTLENIHPSLKVSSPLLYLGTFREWARGGKPEMYFLTWSRLSFQEHFDKLQSEKAEDQCPPGKATETEASERAKNQYAPSEKDLQQGEKYRLWDDASPPSFDPTKVRRRLWELVKKHERTLQESAKAGIYLLARACEEAPQVLEEFFKQFEVKP